MRTKVIIYLSEIFSTTDNKAIRYTELLKKFPNETKLTKILVELRNLNCINITPVLKTNKMGIITIKSNCLILLETERKEFINRVVWSILVPLFISVVGIVISAMIALSNNDKEHNCKYNQCGYNRCHKIMP